MAVSVSNLTSGADETSGTSATTASVSPSANKLLLLSVTSRKDTSEPLVPTISGNGLTWVEVKSVYYDTGSGSRKKLSVFRAMGLSPSTGAITITFGETWTNCYWSLDEFTGMDTSGTNGSGAIVQSTSNFVPGESYSSPTLTVTLGAFSNTNNATYGSFAMDPGTGTLTQGTGFTKIATQDSSTINLGTEFRNDNDTSVDMTCDNVAGTAEGGIAIEVKAASAAGGAFRQYRMMQGIGI